MYLAFFTFMGPVGGFCYFCVCSIIHGPSVGNLRAPLWDFVMVVIMIIQRPIAGNVLRLACYVTFNACFYFYYCILNLVAYISSHSSRCK